jgi:Flp pilus assembly protein TadB
MNHSRSSDEPTTFAPLGASVARRPVSKADTSPFIDRSKDNRLPKRVRHQGWRSRKGLAVSLLWIIVLLLVIFAIGGGVAVSHLLWLVLVVALIVALFAVASGRRV